MPKENINCSTSSDMRVEVCWGPDAEYVQIATVHRDSPARLLDEQINGWFVDLDRKQINRLIEALRRSRDAAYGAGA